MADETMVDIRNERQKLLDELTAELCRVYPGYRDQVAMVLERRDMDWELCSRGALPEVDLLAAYHKVSGIPVQEPDELGDIERYPELSGEYLDKWCCIPQKWDEESMHILISDPYATDDIRYLFREFYGVDVTFSLLRRSVVERLIQSTYLQTGKDETADDLGFELDFEGDEETLRSLASEAKVVRFVNEIFSRAVELEASDIHVEPEEERYVVRFRIDGMLQEHVSGARNQYPAIASRIKLVGGLNIAESRLPQDGRTNMQIGRSEIDVRISTVPIMYGESIVLRILRKDSMDFSLTNIGMSNSMLPDFEKLVSIPHGIILVVGPTGSGKTTTLYTVMSQLNTSDRKIITIEDPVEYVMPGLSQIQVNPKIGLDFASGLRNIVRQDPDVILVGEIRDRETADIAINAALTGHLVLSTLHTNDAPGAISRLLDMGIEGFLISSSLFGVLSQRLVRRICTSCEGSGKDKAERKCRSCGGSGFKGRTGIFELLTVNDEIREAVNRNADSSTIATIARKNGMVPLIEDGRQKVAEGITTESEITRAARE